MLVAPISNIIEIQMILVEPWQHTINISTDIDVFDRDQSDRKYMGKQQECWMNGEFGGIWWISASFMSIWPKSTSFDELRRVSTSFGRSRRVGFERIQWIPAKSLSFDELDETAVNFGEFHEFGQNQRVLTSFDEFRRVRWIWENSKNPSEIDELRPARWIWGKSATFGEFGESRRTL